MNPYLSALQLRTYRLAYARLINIPNQQQTAFIYFIYLSASTIFLYAVKNEATALTFQNTFSLEVKCFIGSG